VTDCSDCVIRLEGLLLSLQMRNLSKCTVIVIGHVKGATMVFGLVDCQIYLASAQVRIHETNRTLFSLRVRSNPIIEDSTDLTFSPLDSGSIGVLSEGERQGITEGADDLSEENGLWGAVNDFNWIRDTPSPSW